MPLLTFTLANILDNTLKDHSSIPQTLRFHPLLHRRQQGPCSNSPEAATEEAEEPSEGGTSSDRDEELTGETTSRALSGTHHRVLAGAGSHKSTMRRQHRLGRPGLRKTKRQRGNPTLSGPRKTCRLKIAGRSTSNPTRRCRPPIELLPRVRPLRTRRHRSSVSHLRRLRNLLRRRPSLRFPRSSTRHLKSRSQPSSATVNTLTSAKQTNDDQIIVSQTAASTIAGTVTAAEVMIGITRADLTRADLTRATETEIEIVAKTIGRTVDSMTTDSETS